MNRSEYTYRKVSTENKSIHDTSAVCFVTVVLDRCPCGELDQKCTFSIYTLRE